MRKFTQFLMTLALLLGGANSVKAEKVYEINYSDYTGFPFYVMGYVPEWVGDIMTDYGANYKYQKKEGDEATPEGATIVKTNNGTEYFRWTTGGGWHQYNIAGDIPTTVGGSYKVKALVKASEAVTLDIEMRWSWSGDYQATTTKVTIPQSEDFVEVEWEHKNIGGASSGLTAKPGTSTAQIEWKEVKVYTADAEPSLNYGDLEVVVPTMYVKNWGEDAPSEATPEATPDGDVYTTADAAGAGDDWMTQFFIKSPTAFPVGQQIYVEFECKADVAQTGIATQTHSNPGSFVVWHCIDNVDFTTTWVKITKTVTVSDDMNNGQTIAFNMHKNSDNKYYIKNIVLKIPPYLGEIVDFTVGPTGWATYSSTKAVSFGTAKAYAAKANGTSVALTPVTEAPAGTAVIIEGSGVYSFDVIASASAIADNDLKVSDGTVTGNGNIYVLAKKDDVVGFYKLANGQTVPAGKAYLEAASAPEFIGIGGTTGINATLNEGVEMTDGVIFDLSGRRVANPTKGIYIKNGKKFIVK